MRGKAREKEEKEKVLHKCKENKIRKRTRKKEKEINEKLQSDFMNKWLKETPRESHPVELGTKEERKNTSMKSKEREKEKEEKENSIQKDKKELTEKVKQITGIVMSDKKESGKEERKPDSLVHKLKEKFEIKKEMVEKKAPTKVELMAREIDSEELARKDEFRKKEKKVIGVRYEKKEERNFGQGTTQQQAKRKIIERKTSNLKTRGIIMGKFKNNDITNISIHRPALCNETRSDEKDGLGRQDLDNGRVLPSTRRSKVVVN